MSEAHFLTLLGLFAWGLIIWACFKKPDSGNEK